MKLCQSHVSQCKDILRAVIDYAGEKQLIQHQWLEPENARTHNAILNIAFKRGNNSIDCLAISLTLARFDRGTAKWACVAFRKPSLDTVRAERMATIKG